MELSLLSREVIAMSAAVGLSHNMFDGALYLGVCDKIVPGLAMAALSLAICLRSLCRQARWPAACQTKKKCVSASCMLKAKRSYGAAGSEAASYHAPGTCTFYGTANTNQMVVEFGDAAAGSSFMQPDAPLRRR
jgi:phosphogluconate dehydratase